MNEPATGRIPPGAMRFDHGRFSHERFHNQYGLLMAMATTAGLLDAMPDRRTFVLTRAGFAGIQRYAANWMGDNVSRWDHLWLSIPMAMGLGLSGQAFVGADVGGFVGHTNAELFLRWMQYGTLTPFCRNHSEIGNADQYAWTWGETIEDLVRAAIELRYRLLPYVYAAFLTASETGAPVQRPLVFDHQDDPAVRDIDDQYLFGPDLLVAPVVEAGMTARQVYLPAGAWYDWHGGEAIAGAAVRGRADADGPHPAVRARGRGRPDVARGAAVDRRPPSGGDRAAPLRPAGRRHAPVVPAGGRRAHVRRPRRRPVPDDVRRSRARGDRVTLRAEVDGDGYPEFAREAFVLVVHGAAPGDGHGRRRGAGGARRSRRDRQRRDRIRRRVRRVGRRPATRRPRSRPRRRRASRSPRPPGRGGRTGSPGRAGSRAPRAGRAGSAVSMPSATTAQRSGPAICITAVTTARAPTSVSMAAMNERSILTAARRRLLRRASDE